MTKAKTTPETRDYIVLSKINVSGGALNRGDTIALTDERAEGMSGKVRPVAPNITPTGVDARDGTIVDLEGKIAELEGRIVSLTADISSNDAEIVTLKATHLAKVSELEGQLSELTNPDTADEPDEVEPKEAKKKGK